MKKVYPNTLGSERTVELEFFLEVLQTKATADTRILDVGGIPSQSSHFANIYKHINDNNLNYSVCDFRGGKYQGDFVTYNFKDEKFDIVIFCSSLEHFPQCTENDTVFREGEDKRGFKKALSILNEGGLILLTVPFGKHVWQPYHQNYDWNGILELTEGTEMVYKHIYKLVNSKENKFTGEWVFVEESETRDITYTDRAYGCGCFLLKKL
jgi:hypothetical protein